DGHVTGVQTCALPICGPGRRRRLARLQARRLPAGLGRSTSDLARAAPLRRRARAQLAAARRLSPLPPPLPAPDRAVGARGARLRSEERRGGEEGRTWW